MADDPIERIRPDELKPTKGTERSVEPEKQAPNPSEFQSHMKETPPAAGQKGVSPMELQGADAAKAAGPTLPSLIQQASQTQETLSDIQKKLKTPNLRFKRQHQYLLKNKLTDANNHLRSAIQKLGGEVPATKKPPKGAGPLEKFISLVGDGQDKMHAVTDQLKSIGESDKKMSPTDYLIVQVKLAQAQQEIEYSSVLLSKMVDALKQTLNIQI